MRNRFTRLAVWKVLVNGSALGLSLAVMAICLGQNSRTQGDVANASTRSYGTTTSNTALTRGSDGISTRPSTNGSYMRVLSDIDLSVQFTKEKVLAIWGPPDAVVGSGVQYLQYKLSDGDVILLHFAQQPPHPLLMAIIPADHDKPTRQLFDGTDRTPLR